MSYVKVFLLTLFLVSASCYNNQEYKKFGKVSFQASAKDSYFTYTIDDSFYKKYQDLGNNQTHPRLSDAEFKMLNQLLKDKKYCTKNSYNPSFEILSKQKKIYDTTFAKLIAENYNTRSTSPVTYIGKCL